MDMRKWFKEAQYGMMVHWGLYSLLDSIEQCAALMFF